MHLLTYDPGVRRTWTRLLAGECGVVSTRSLGDEFARLPSQVAGLVPIGKLEDGGWDAAEHVTKDVSILIVLWPLASNAAKLQPHICCLFSSFLLSTMSCGRSGLPSAQAFSSYTLARQ